MFHHTPPHDEGNGRHETVATWASVSGIYNIVLDRALDQPGDPSIRASIDVPGRHYNGGDHADPLAPFVCSSQPAAAFPSPQSLNQDSPLAGYSHDRPLVAATEQLHDGPGTSLRVVQYNHAKAIAQAPARRNPSAKPRIKDRRVSGLGLRHDVLQLDTVSHLFEHLGSSVFPSDPPGVGSKDLNAERCNWEACRHHSSLWSERGYTHATDRRATACDHHHETDRGVQEMSKVQTACKSTQESLSITVTY